MPVFSINKTLAAIQSLSQSGTQENADIVADLLGVNLEPKVQPSKYIKLDLSGSYDVDLHNDVFNAMNNGTLSIEDYKAAFEHLIADLPQFAADLGKKTKSVLLNMGGPFFESRYKSDKKDEVRDALIDKFIKNYVIASSFSYSPSFGGRDKYLQSLIRPVRAKVDAATQETLDEHALQIKTARDEKAAAMIERAKGTENPQSLEDFRNIIRNSLQQQMTAAGVDQRTNEMLQNARMSMTVEQRAKYDELEAIESRTKRMGNSEPKPVTVQSASQSVSGTITETTHTKKGHALFVVQLSERLDKDDYSRVNAAAKNLGGYYSSYRGGGAVVGFQFTTMENAQAFLALAGGDTALAQAAVDAKRDAFADDKTQSSVTRLKEMSARLNARAVESLGQDRLANTARRARFAASAEAAANADKALAATMLNIAVAQESGRAIFLNKVRQKAQVELLQGIVRTAKDAELHKKYPSYGDYLKHIGEAPTIETADSAAYPYYQAYRSDLADIARKLILVEGTKMMGQRLLKNVDDVTDAYLKFAKENIGKLNVYRKSNDSSLAAFTKKADAERAIEHSGFNGKAIVLNVAKGEWLIIPSPSEAMKLGLWKGDDKLIILSPEFGAELVEKIGAINRKKANVALPWQLESAHERRQKLSALGIETPAEYRTMLREFIGLIQTPEVPSKIKEMERAMVGRRNDGLDLFPTPEKVVSQMIDAADIQEGMRVLEPSAGMGHIADVLREQGIETDVAEISPDRRELLKEKGYAVIGQDFMDMDSRTTFTYGDVFKDENGRLGIMRGGGSLGSGRVRFFLLDENGKEKENSGEWMSRDELTGVEHRGVDSGYDRIIMNPPFSDRRDIAHVMHAYNLLKVGGKLVAIMGEGAFFGSDKKATEFRDWLDEVGGSSEKLDEGSFNDPTLPVTTNANTRMVVIVRGKEQKAGFDSIDDQAHESATSPHNDIPEPTLAQKIAGNYKVGKITISGLSISIENPKGSTRSGVDADGNEWSNVMKHHYGFIRGSHGADGDHVDVFVKPNTSENFNGNVYVIDQKDPLTGKFDEHKAIIGAISEADAKAIYLANYEKDWQGLAAITALPMAAFKPWVLSSEAKKPLAIFDSLNGNTSLMDALALITSLSKKKSEAVAQQLAVAIGVQIEKPVTDNAKDLPKPKKKIKTYGFNRYLMSQNLTNEELEILTELTRLKHKTNKNGFYLYDKQGLKKLDTLSWIATWRIKDNDESKFGKMLDTEDIMRIREDVRKDYEIGLYDDLGGFTFTPAIALNSTLDAIMALAKNNSQANAEKLAQLLGVTLAPTQELDMFGDPIQSQGFDLFGDPIQDGEDSPVEDLPRLAVVELPLSKLTLSEDVPQFKSGADDESGVVEALGGKFDRTGVAPIQIWERTDGRLEIISGRHRTDLARRSGEKTIPAQVHKESEGFTAKQAMMLDAELNIRDGQGKVKDYVDYFTHSEISEDEADKRGLLARSIGQRAFTVASKGGDELKTLHRNEIISDQAAADIATLAPKNSAMQAVGLRVLQESKPLNNALNTMRAVMALTREKGQEPDTFDLFGFDDSALKEAEAMAKIASRKQRQINEQLTAIKGAVKNPKAAAKHGVIVENQADALEKVKTMTTLKSRWDNWSSHADLLAEVRQEIAEKGGYDSVMSEDDWLLDSLNSDGWIGVDLDSTLAYHDEWQGIEHIGDPIPAMLNRVIKWIDQGKDVRIFTARADNAEAIPYIDAWCMKHLGKVLPVTNVKDMSMIELWDDRAIKVEKNTGQVEGYDSLSMPSLTDYDVIDVDTDEIKLNPTAYQWRNNVTGDGTEKGRTVSGIFNYDDQPPLILHRRLSGRVYLADGHHRFKMAKASHAPIVKAIVLDEHDGYTVPAMRVLCGFLNLRKDALVKDRVKLPMVNMAKTADLVRKAVEDEMGW